MKTCFPRQRSFPRAATIAVVALLAVAGQACGGADASAARDLEANEAAASAPSPAPEAPTAPAAAGKEAAAAAAAPSLDSVSATGTSLPSPPGIRGELLFQSDREGPTRLFVLDVATASQRRVGTAGEWADEEPSWSHDGRRITFSSTRAGAGNFDIWVMNADGTGLARLTEHAAPERDPVWAHDDKSVYYSGEQDGRNELYRVWVQDKRVERVTSGIDKILMPAVSPDGRYLAYAAQTIMSFQIHLKDLTNGTTRQITAGGGACRPSFNPNSQEVAFVRLDQDPSRLEVVRESGPRVVLEHEQTWSYYPSYSPDGRYLAFSVSPEHHQGEDWDLAVMDLQTPGKFDRVTSGPGNDRVPVWRPAIR